MVYLSFCISIVAVRYSPISTRREIEDEKKGQSKERARRKGHNGHGLTKR